MLHYLFEKKLINGVFFIKSLQFQLELSYNLQIIESKSINTNKLQFATMINDWLYISDEYDWSRFNTISGIIYSHYQRILHRRSFQYFNLFKHLLLMILIRVNICLFSLQLFVTGATTMIRSLLRPKKCYCLFKRFFLSWLRYVTCSVFTFLNFSKFQTGILPWNKIFIDDQFTYFQWQIF